MAPSAPSLESYSINTNPTPIRSVFLLMFDPYLTEIIPSVTQ